RKEPREWTVGGVTKRIDKHLETFYSLPEPDDIRNRWGGGAFEIKVGATKEGRGFQWIAARTVEVAGDPIVELDSAEKRKEDERILEHPVVQEFVTYTRKLLEDQTARRLELEEIVEQLQDEIQQLRAELANTRGA